MGNASLFKTLGKIAGIGGIAFGLLIVIFGEFLRKSIFPSLSTDQAYNILKLLLLLTFAAGIIGVVVWALNAGVKMSAIVVILAFAALVVYMGNQRLEFVATEEKHKPDLTNSPPQSIPSSTPTTAVSQPSPIAEKNGRHEPAEEHRSAELILSYEGQTEVLRRPERASTLAHTPNNDSNQGHCPNEVGHHDNRWCTSRTTASLTTKPPYFFKNPKTACSGFGCQWATPAAPSISADGLTATSFIDNWGRDVDFTVLADEYERLSAEQCAGPIALRIAIREGQIRDVQVKKECAPIAVLKCTLLPSGSESVFRFGDKTACEGKVLREGAIVDYGTTVHASYKYAK